VTQVVKLYHVIRSAHLERIRSDSSTTLLYVTRRYDFDPSLATGVDLRKRGVLGGFWFALLNDIDVLEINEPLMLVAAPRTLATILGTRLRSSLLRREAAKVVTYAIENKDPRGMIPALPIRSRCKWWFFSRIVPWVWRSIDRIAFGTEGSAQLYGAMFSLEAWPDSQVISAVPAPDHDTLRTDIARDFVVAFLGDLAPRKGFPLVADAWGTIAASVVGAHLLVIGKGSGESAARELAASDPNVELHIDPPREQIIPLLSRAKVLVLPSQPTSRWREQVGLPIVEGLSVGCEIVTTTETGIADWLEGNGHRVLSVPTLVPTLAEAVITALHDNRGPARILASLPSVDGRRSAEDWLFSGLLQMRGR